MTLLLYECILINNTLNGPTSAYFTVGGEEFSCGFDAHFGDILGSGEKGWITFSGYGGHKWRIKEKGDE